jgi:ATP-dependent Lhr-like helicase
LLHRHFMSLMAVFTAPPEFTVLHGRDEIGRVDPSLLADRVEGPRADGPVSLTQRASGVLAGLRSGGIGRVQAGWLVIRRDDDDLRWWTWAGYRVNATLKATFGNVADEAQRVDDLSIRLRNDLRASTWRGEADAVRDRLCLPEVDDKALTGLKFSEALPRHLAVVILAARLADLDHARAVLTEPVRFER